MTTFNIFLSKSFCRQLSELERHEALLILLWMDKHINRSSYPVRAGRSLNSALPGIWRYRVGHYRIMSKIEGQKMIILALETGYEHTHILSESLN